MTKQSYIIGVLVVALLVVGVLYVSAPTQVPTDENSIVSKVLEKFGAMPGNELQGPEFTVNGIKRIYVNGRMQNATTTLCSFKNPFGAATSTLESFDYQITTGTSTAASLVVTASTMRYASSTGTNIVSAQAVASGAQDSMSWISGGTADKGEIAPNYYALLKSEGAGLSGYTFTGNCQAVFRGFNN